MSVQPKPSPSTSTSASSMPDAMVILFFIMVLAAIASHLIPAGSFQLLEPAPVAQGAAKVTGKLDPNSFRFAEDHHGDLQQSGNYWGRACR